MKRVISVALLAVLVTAFFIGAWPGPRVDPADSCVLIFNERGHGSGVIVGANCVLTAQHVADFPNLAIRTSDNVERPVVRIVKDPDSDMALLYIGDKFTQPPLLFDRRPLKVGDQITLIGAPYDKTLMNCILRGRVVKVDVDIPDYGYRIRATNVDILDCHGGPGASGGPVLDRHGRIRSVLIVGHGVLCGAVPVEELNL